MAIRIFRALGKAYFNSLLTGIGSTILLLFLSRADDAFYLAFIWLLLDFFLPFLLCIGLLLPLASIERRRIGNETFRKLLVRYLPLIVLPGAIFFYLELITDEMPADDKPWLLLTLGYAAALGYITLWTFLKHMKAPFHEKHIQIH